MSSAVNSYAGPRTVDILPDTLTTRTQRICGATARIADNLRELSSRLVLDNGAITGKTSAINPTPTDPAHQQACLDLTEQRLSSIEEMLSSLLTRI